jgi:hypothetical protein
MSEELPAQAQSIFRLLNTLPPLPDKVDTTTHGPCVSCGKVKHLTDFNYFNSGVINPVMEPLCSECRSTFVDCSKIVCCKCKAVLGWVDPHVDPDKFVFEKRHSYHIKTCPNCTSGLMKADLIEKIIYLQRKQKGLI